jgi:tetratricopeptide (TPR) repeat protein
MLARDYDGAIDALLHTLELDPHFAAAHSVLGCVYARKGMFEEALAQFETVRSLAGGNPMIDASIKALTGCVYAAAGQRIEAMKIIEEVSKPPAASSYSIAGIYAALGENDRAFECLNSAYQARSFEMVSLKVDPSLDNLRSDSRFQDLVARVGLA